MNMWVYFSYSWGSWKKNYLKVKIHIFHLILTPTHSGLTQMNQTSLDRGECWLCNASNYVVLLRALTSLSRWKERGDSCHRETRSQIPNWDWTAARWRLAAGIRDRLPTWGKFQSESREFGMKECYEKKSLGVLNLHATRLLIAKRFVVWVEITVLRKKFEINARPATESRKSK